MKIAGMFFQAPTLSGVLGLITGSLIIIGTVYKVGISINDGTIRNHPEILRQLVFWPFSIVFAIRMAAAFGLFLNKMPQKILMVMLFYIPSAVLLAYIGGIFSTI